LQQHPFQQQQYRYITTFQKNFHKFHTSKVRETRLFEPSSLAEAKATLKYRIPRRTRQKLISAEDAVALIRDHDTVAISGFVTQGAPEAVLQALGDRFEETGSPQQLTALFGGGPGDYGERGVSHLGRRREDGSFMLKRAIGGHYGQVPQVASLALEDKIAAWTLPMGSISRMIRAQSTHSPGHITTVGIGTYVDPDEAGGAANEMAKKSSLHSQLVTKLEIDGTPYLMYKALPIDVAIIRGTTADSQGNVSVEHESLLCDQKIVAAAAKNSGGIVIAQVKRVADNGSIPSREVAVPGPLVDCVVVVDDEDHDSLHGMSFMERHNPALTGEIRAPQESIERMPLGLRKFIARRAFFGLKPNTIINLGIGLPEGVASVAAEEGMLEYITLSTEPGVFGGLPASGHSFGPAYNAHSLLEMNQMFDFYDGGGLDMCFLGAAQVSPTGDVNVSRMSKDRLTGPGGFIDISQSTMRVCFVTSFTAKGLKVGSTEDGTLKIAQEGAVKKFVPEVYEKTFSGHEAVHRGQSVYYVTERAVFRRTRENDVIELIEIAPGMDLQKDILDQMDFVPAISPNLKTMDPRIFKEGKMDVAHDFFGSLEDRFNYSPEDHTVYFNLFGMILNKEEDVEWMIKSIEEIISPLVAENGKVNMVYNYEGFEIAKDLSELYRTQVHELQDKYYKSVKRYAGQAFQRAQLKNALQIVDFDSDELFDQCDQDKDGVVSMEELRYVFQKNFGMSLTQAQMQKFLHEGSETDVDREKFAAGLKNVLESN